MLVVGVPATPSHLPQTQHTHNIQHTTHTNTNTYTYTQNELGMTLLHVAAWEGHDSALAILLENGAEPNVIDGAVNKCTPLVSAPAPSPHMLLAACRVLLALYCWLQIVCICSVFYLHVVCVQIIVYVCISSLFGKNMLLKCTRTSLTPSPVCLCFLFVYYDTML